MNCDLASQSVRRRKNELRFGFPEYLEKQKRIAVGLPGVPEDAKTNHDWASLGDEETRKELRCPCNVPLKLER